MGGEGVAVSETFGDALAEFRQERGLSLRGLAGACGIDYAYIHRLEKGEKNSPSDDVVDSLSAGLRLAPRDYRRLRRLAGGPGWVRFPDEPPPVDEIVIFVCSESVVRVGWRSAYGDWYRCGDGNAFPGYVTHWQPLPEPPPAEFRDVLIDMARTAR